MALLQLSPQLLLPLVPQNLLPFPLLRQRSILWAFLPATIVKAKDLVDKVCPVCIKLDIFCSGVCLLCLLQAQSCLQEQERMWKHRLPVHLAPAELANVPPASLQALPSFQ